MQSYRQLMLALRQIQSNSASSVLVHASLSSLGQMPGGAQAVVAALLDRFETVVMPTFTYQTMIVPENGPENNGMAYGKMGDSNKMAQIFYPELPADKLMGVIAETLRQLPKSQRSLHPILSFSGVNANDILVTQTLDKPLSPIAALADLDATVTLIGVGHTANTSIHLGERLAGRKTFTRWALVPDMVVECPGFPSCSDGFDAIVPHIEAFTQRIQLGEAVMQVIPMGALIETSRSLVEKDPYALLCDKPGCDRCNAVRTELEN